MLQIFIYNIYTLTRHHFKQPILPLYQKNNPELLKFFLNK